MRSIGAQTEMGKIGNALQKVQPEVTPLQREMNRLVSRLLGIALCVDKTGTLTLNQIAVQQLCAYNHPENLQPYDLGLHSQVPLPEAVHSLVEFSILASQRDPFDPMEKAFKELGEYSLANTEHLHILPTYGRTPTQTADLIDVNDAARFLKSKQCKASSSL